MTLTYGIGPELAHIAVDRSMLGFNVPVVGAWTLSMSNFIDLAGRDAEPYPVSPWINVAIFRWIP